MSDIPRQKRSSDELDDLRRRNAFAVKPPIQQIKALELPLPLIGILYTVVTASVVLYFTHYYIPAICCAGPSLLASLFIFWKKPRSSHHACIITIISLLVLVFGSVYYLEQFEPTAHEEPQRSTRY